MKMQLKLIYVSVNAFKKNKRHLNHRFAILLLHLWLRMHFETLIEFCYNHHAVSQVSYP